METHLGSHMAAISRNMSKNGSRRFTPPRQRGLSLTTNYQNMCTTVKTPVGGFDVTASFRSKKCSLV